MSKTRAYSDTIERLKVAGLRPTRQRLALAKLLFDRGDRHLSAEQLFAEARDSDVRVSLATVYNTLHQFTAAGLLREVVVDAGRSYFDTNMGSHQHFYVEETGELMDVAGDAVRIVDLPTPPEGREIDRVDIVIRLK